MCNVSYSHKDFRLKFDIHFLFRKKIARTSRHEFCLFGVHNLTFFAFSFSVGSTSQNGSTCPETDILVKTRQTLPITIWEQCNNRRSSLFICLYLLFQNAVATVEVLCKSTWDGYRERPILEQSCIRLELLKTIMIKLVTVGLRAMFETVAYRICLVFLVLS